MFKEANAANIQFSAMSLLAVREHSAFELQQKLRRKFDNIDLINQVIADLTARNLQSDERFAEAFVKMRMGQGKGPVRIQYDLKDKGISAELMAVVFDESDSSWMDLAQEVRVRRFGSMLPQTQKDKAKQIRFLQYRGFNSTQIRKAFLHDND